MSQLNFNKKSIITIAVVVITGIAIISLLKEETGRNTENPFEYNIDNFKKADSNLLTYTEETPLPVAYTDYYGITIDVNDNLYVSVDKKIIRFNKDKKPVLSFNITDPAYCLASDASDLYLGMADHIEIYDSTGKRKTVWDSLGKKAILTSLAITKDFVFAADAGNLVIWKFDKSGKIIAEIGRRDVKKDIPGFVIPSPYFDIAIDSDESLWAANTGRHSLENYRKDGSIRTSWGVTSMGPEGFSGCCNPSHFVILEDGSFVTSEKGIPRIKVYNNQGILQSVVAGPEKFIDGTVDLDLAVDSEEKIYTLDHKKKAVRIFKKIIIQK